jgi:methylase of polypeptide subunit release factors
MSVARQHAEWLRLIDVSGPFLSVPVLKDAFPQGLDAHEPGVSHRLREGYEDWQENPRLHRQWIRYVLGDLLGHPDEVLLEGQAVPQGLRHTVGEHRETLFPDFVLADPESGKARVLVQVNPPGTGLERPLAGSRWKESPAGRMAVLLRGTDVRLGLVTNGEHWTLVDAPPNATTGFATWRSDLWLEEPITLRAFRTLLGPRRLFGVPEPERLEALLAASAERQKEVTDQLGRQVRRAVEILVHALDRADRESGRTLLEGVSERELYDAAVTFMMRLVFLFCAEEQGLFPLDDEQYAGNYAASTLFGQLNDAAEQGGEEVLERRTDAWQRLLATFRAIHGGVDHEGMALPPYGGHLFAPDRFPFLEGRPRESRWRATAARPLPITNRTVLHLLSALQLLRDAKTGEAQRLSFRALDIEQIGHVYEGLLDHTVKKATSPMVSLKGKEAEEPEVTVDRLEALLATGPETLVKEVAELSERSAKAVAKDLAIGLAPQDEHPLAVACENDSALAARVRPFVGLVRRDAAGLPVVIPAGSHFVTAGSDRRSTGTHYTPRSLTEPIVRYTLEPLVWEGPAEGKPETEWALRSAKEILALKVCDMACGSGAFLVEACRYLSKRLVEAWAEAEKANPGKVLITPEGAMSEGRLAESIIPREDEERLALARRLVVDRCLYGVDINPMAVEMAKLSLWLVTLQKNVAFTFLDHCIRCGDSLLGVTDLRQIETLSMDPSNATAPLFLEEACRRAVARARAAREKLEGFTVKDVRDAEAKEAMLGESEQAVSVVKALADITTGAVLRRSTVDLGALQALLREVVSEPEGPESTSAYRNLQKIRLSLLTLSPSEGRSNPQPLQWPTEFPEVFSVRQGFDGIMGNPPFLGGKRISTELSVDYAKALKEIVTRGEKGAADLVCFFFRKAAMLLNSRGRMGLLATNTISQGDSRVIGLEGLLRSSGGQIERADTDLPWPGDASTVVSRVIYGRQENKSQRWLNSEPVETISTHLDGVTEGLDVGPVDAQPIFASAGTYLYGEGFVLSPDEAREMVAAYPNCTDVLRPYLIADDLNSSPTCSAGRYAIDFGERTEKEARGYAPAFARIEKLVKPLRDGLTEQIHEACYWKHWDKRPELYRRLKKLKLAIASSRVTKYFLFSFVPADLLFGDRVVVFASDDPAMLGVLQSEVHQQWAYQRMTSQGKTPGYSVSKTFRTFVFPSTPIAAERTEELRLMVSDLLATRKNLMETLGVGLTDLYNLYHDSASTNPSVRSLRGLQVSVDETVLDLYGWSDIQLDHQFREDRAGVRFTVGRKAAGELLLRMARLNQATRSSASAAGAKSGKRARRTHRGTDAQATFLMED